MKILKITVLAGIICIITSLVIAGEGVKDNALVILSSDNFSQMEEAVNFIEGKGGRIVHLFPTHILIGHIPKAISQDLVEKNGILSIHYGLVETVLVEKYGKMAVYAVEAWNRNYIFLQKPMVKEKEIRKFAPLINDTRIAPESLRKELAPLKLSPEKPYGAGTNDTSEYMIGKIAVSVILPESTGTNSSEDWTSEEITQVHAEIQSGMNWWADREPKAGLQFFYDLKGTVSTSHEPITLSAETEYLWINEVMSNIGYSSGSHYNRVRNYNDGIQSDKKTDWVFTIFVVDSSKDLDGEFSDGDFAYAYPGGTFMVMTYDNNGWGINNMDAVCAHEVGHIFYALDEYVHQGGTKSESAGYLNVENGNYNGTISCIMRDNSTSAFDNGNVCHFTRGQVGLWDENSNGILDILDTGKVNLSNPIYHQGTTTLTYEGTATILPPLKNKNQYSAGHHPPYHTITVSSITNVQYKIDQGNWVDIGNIQVVESHPHNGTLTTKFWFTTPPLFAGTHCITVRAINSVAYPLQAYYTTSTIVFSPSQFSLIFPPNATTISTLTINFAWGTSTAEWSTITYTILYGTDSTFNNAIIQGNLSQNNYKVLLPPTAEDKTYYWKVIATDKYNSSTESDIWRFHVNLFNEPPGTSTLLWPPSGIITSNLTPIFRWSEVVDPDPNDTVTYDLWYSKNPDFSQRTEITDITTTYYRTSSPLDNNSTYYWKVGTKDKAGSMTCSKVSTLTTRPIIVYPNPLYSKDNQITFAHLTENSTIKIFTIAGELIKTLKGDDYTGKAKWHPEGVASGIYIYVIESEGEVITGKIGILR